ncbi:hypothetical protein BS47DRAFT_704909 [Hydnum rufescens UP504]|uniref:Uncharacterized protein n=1 Tax=Hydnum rufescens UP504 TaxID=1448309 RepID=A0A9P6DYX4_9AGAM|nr:hypothetical protein BS47DRAFT_704909 [Hydnum rufescens UP504]
MSEAYPPVTAVKPDTVSIDWNAPSDSGPSTASASLSAWEQVNSLDPRSRNENLVKCSQCTYLGPVSSFPLRLNGNGHVKTCSKHTKPRRVDSKTGHSPTPSANVTTVSWTTLLEEIHLQAQGQVDLDRFIEFDENHPGVTGDTLLIRANTVMDRIKTAAGYRFNYKRRQDSTQKARKSTVFTYYCAQLEGEQTKHALHPDERRRRPKKLPKIPRFHCNGWASLTVTEEVPTIMRLRMTHAFAHVACFSNRPAGAGVGKPRPSGSSFSNSTRLGQSDPTAGIRRFG